MAEPKYRRGDLVTILPKWDDIARTYFDVKPFKEAEGKVWQVYNHYIDRENGRYIINYSLRSPDYEYHRRLEDAYQEAHSFRYVVREWFLAPAKRNDVVLEVENV